MYRRISAVVLSAAAMLMACARAEAQGLSLLGLESTEAAPVVTAPVALVDESAVLELARIVAAEAGGDTYSNLRAQTAVAAAMVNKIRQKYQVEAVTGALVRRFTIRDEPWFLSSRKDSNAYLYRKDAAWLIANGWANTLVGARAALAGDDPSAGATNWHDTSIRTPYGSKVVVTARIPSGKRGLVFYKFKIPEA